jgi:hypothetical protein
VAGVAAIRFQVAVVVLAVAARLEIGDDQTHTTFI